MSGTTMNRRRHAGGASVRAVVVAGVLISIFVALRILAAFSWDPAAFLAFGTDAPHITAFAEDELGRDVPVRAAQGHDGKFFFVQAVDPLYLDPLIAETYLDRPTYRAQRMLYPITAAGLGLFPASWLPWTMLLTNVGSMVLGTYATARVAKRLGGSAWWGLAFTLNPGTLSELFIGGAGILAFALAMLAVAWVQESRWWPAAFAFAGAALSREALLLFVAGVALLVWRRHGFARGALISMVPGVTVVAWAVYLRMRLDSTDTLRQIQEFGWPFQGIVGAFPRWLDSPVDLIGAFVILATGTLVVWRSARRHSYVGWGASGYLLLAVVFSRQVWLRYFDISRAVVPLLTAYFLVSFVAPRSTYEASPPDR